MKTDADRAGERVDDEKADGEITDGAKETAAWAIRAPRPDACKKYVRTRVARALPELMRLLIAKAAEGSIAHMKLVIQIGGLDKIDAVPGPKPKRGKSLEQILNEAWEKDQKDAEARAAAKEAARAEAAVASAAAREAFEAAGGRVGYSGLDGGVD